MRAVTHRSLRVGVGLTLAARPSTTREAAFLMVIVPARVPEFLDIPADGRRFEAQTSRGECEAELMSRTRAWDSCELCDVMPLEAATGKNV